MDRRRRESLCVMAVLSVLIKRHQLVQEELVMTRTSNYQLKRQLVLKYTNNRIPKITSFYSDVIVLLESSNFRQHFRMSKETFNLILNHLGPYWMEHFNKRQEGGHAQLSLEKNLLIALWALASPDSYRSIAEKFGVGKCTVYACLQRTVFLVNSYLCKRFIKWPLENDRETIAERFKDKCGFPQVIGAIDGCHIPIKRPTEHGNDYFNRKKFYSLVLQGVCDADMRFIDVDCTWPGSVHDARVFRTSPLSEQGDILCQPDYFVVADAAYPCRRWMLSPYRDNGILNGRQRYFNTQLSKTRVVIENAFALLKGRFRRLKYLEMHSPEDLVKTIICCCVLHNLCLDDSEDVEQLIRDGAQLDHALHEQEDYVHAAPPQENDFRTVITDYLWNNRR